LSIGDQIGGGDTEASAQDAIGGCRRATTLDVAENGNVNFLLEHLAEGKGDAVGHATGSDRGNGLATGIGSGQFDAFGDHDKAEALAAKFTGANGVADGFEFERYFGDQDDVRASTNTGMKSDPADIAARLR
jgi:hypothetical protein